jgi:hypothetical protein
LGGAFALSATRDEPPETGPGTVEPTTTPGQETTEPMATELLYTDDFSHYDSGVFNMELTNPGYRTLSIAFESSDPVPGLRIGAEVTETAGEGSHYLGVSCVHLTPDITRSAIAFGIDSRAQSFELIREGNASSAQLEQAVRSEIRRPPGTNLIRAECVDLDNGATRLSLFVNGRLLTATMATSIGGFNQAALVVSASTGGAAGYFDDVVVYSLGN